MSSLQYVLLLSISSYSTFSTNFLFSLLHYLPRFFILLLYLFFTFHFYLYLIFPRAPRSGDLLSGFRPLCLCAFFS
jgi:hypothetical protein